MIVHNSMAHDNNNKLGFKKGQKTRLGTIQHITKAGEVIFEDGSWTYDYELAGEEET